jgi:delta24-sterol reductase
MKPQWTAINASRPGLQWMPGSTAYACGKVKQRSTPAPWRLYSTLVLSITPQPRRAINCSNRPLRTSIPRNQSLNCLQQPRNRQHATTSASPSGQEQHQKTVEAISASVREYYSRKESFRIYHGSTNSTRSLTSKKNLVNTSSLSNVLKVSPETKTCLVEPNVPMDRLVEATLRYGLVPPVVMEFPGITVGGGYSGTSGESSSFKHGFFDRTINWVEMVLANGEVVKISPKEKADLFHGAAGAVGTFGVTTLVELQLQEAKKYVETTYHPISGGMSEAIEKLQQATSEPDLDYIDGIMFSKTKGAIITGRLTNGLRSGISIQRFSAASDPWFYLHVQKATTKNPSTPTTEAIPLPEYLFRYDRGGFWVGASAFSYFKFPFNRLTRWWLDDFLHTRMMYTALHASGQSKKYIVQDLALPYSTAEKFVDYTDKEFGIYPLWLCPLKQSPYPTMHPHSQKDGTLKNMLNIGLWGFGPKNHSEFIRKNRDLEKKLRELGGMKWLYAHTYYTQDEFWQQFDRKWYEDLRTKYDARSLPSVYEKVKVDIEAEMRAEREKSLWSRLGMMWPFGGLYGIKKAIESRTYIAARNSAWKSFGKSD